AMANNAHFQTNVCYKLSDNTSCVTDKDDSSTIHHGAVDRLSIKSYAQDDKLEATLKG
ncbi:hypothetical protein FRX31_031510, partial [Thalictrum thalictroides]